MTIEFLDIDVLVEAHGGDPRVRVLDSPAGQTTGQPFVAPFQELELDNFILRVGRPRTTRRAFQMPGADAKSLAEAKDVGGRLLGALFPGPAMGCLVGSLAQARAQNKGLRIRLRLADCPDLTQYPWEFLYDARVDRFLCLSAQTPIVRYLELPEASAPLRVESPLRILVVISKPSDVPALDVEQEWSKLEIAMASVVDRGLVEIDRLPTATMTELARHLRTGHYHVLHFIGHGGYDETGQNGVVVFEGTDGRSRLVSADELGTHLHDHRSMGLVLLNSCEGARGGGTDPFSGTAQSLIQQGLGAVIAMQFEVTDEAAIAFSETFYEALALGYPVDAAVAEGRKSVLSLPNPLEWATPVLYLRAQDGRIFDVTVAPEAAAVAPRAPLPDDIQPVAAAAASVPSVPPVLPIPAPWWRRWQVLAGAAAALVIVIGLLGLLAGGDDDGNDGGTAGEVVTATVRVEGNRAWTNTGIDVAEGDSLDIVATGTVLHDTSNPASAVGPNGVGGEGEINTPGKGVYVNPPGHGGLVARLGDGAPVFGLGAQMTDNVSGYGPLQLGINDFNSGNVEDAVANNSGYFVVRIRVTRRS